MFHQSETTTISSILMKHLSIDLPNLKSIYLGWNSLEGRAKNIYGTLTMESNSEIVSKN